MGKLFDELKRRTVVHVAAVYISIGISIRDRPRLFLCFGSIAITRNKQTWSVPHLIPHLINSRNLI